MLDLRFLIYLDYDLSTKKYRNLRAKNYKNINKTNILFTVKIWSNFHALNNIVLDKNVHYLVF